MFGVCHISVTDDNRFYTTGCILNSVLCLNTSDVWFQKGQWGREAGEHKLRGLESAKVQQLRKESVLLNVGVFVKYFNSCFCI